MIKMFRGLAIVFLWVGLLIMIQIDVFATSGALKKTSIKTCPDGVTYGYHGADNHWHQAETHPKMSSGWASVGDALPGDPCPNESTSTGGTSAYVTPAITFVKSSETGISTLKINGEDVSPISDEMDYESTKSKFEVEIGLTDEKADYKIIGNTSKLEKDENREIAIIVTAEDGSSKTYQLKIIRKMIPGTARLTSLKVNGEAVELMDGVAMNIKMPNNQDELMLVYELSEPEATLRMVNSDGEATITSAPLEVGENNFVLTVVDSDGNEYGYNLQVDREGSNTDIIVGSVVTIAVGGGVGYYFYNKNKNKKKK